MKKLATFLLTAAVAVGACGAFAACSDEGNTWEGDTVEITCLDADASEVTKSVPYNPDRVAILDYAVLDMMKVFGIQDKVVSSAKGTLSYLQDIWDAMDAGTIANLGNLQSYSMEELSYSDPDIIFIGGRQSGNYAAFEEIAPVVYLSVDAGNIVEGTLKNAKTVAKIFGVDDSKVEEFEADITPRIAALRAFSKADDDNADTQTALVLMYSSSFSALSSDGRCSLITSELGFNIIEADASSSSGSGSGSGSGSSSGSGSGQGSGSGSGSGHGSGGGGFHGSSVSYETLLAKNPDYIFVLNRAYITSNGETNNNAPLEALNNDVVNATNAAKNGNIIVMASPDAWYTAEGGMLALDAMLSDLETAFGISAS